MMCSNSAMQQHRVLAQSAARVCAPIHLLSSRAGPVRIYALARRAYVRRRNSDRDSRACQPCLRVSPGQNRSGGQPGMLTPKRDRGHSGVRGAGRWFCREARGAGRWSAPPSAPANPDSPTQPVPTWALDAYVCGGVGEADVLALGDWRLGRLPWIHVHKPNMFVWSWCSPLTVATSRAMPLSPIWKVGMCYTT